MFWNEEQGDARLEPAEVFYWRTRVGEEVDFVRRIVLTVSPNPPTGPRPLR